MSHVDFYFDYASPFAYLASERIEGLVATAGATMTWKPFLLGGLFKAIGTPIVPIQVMSPAKRRHALVDMQRWADHWGVSLNWPSRFPMNTVKALRITLLLDDPAPFVHAVMRAYWADDRDINDPAELTALCTEAGVDPTLLARTSDPEVKTLLREATEGAQAAGVFGVPSFLIDGQLFWGQDRLDFVEKALAGWRPVG